jgi:predicted MFS family arabinose efflux permease
MTGSYAMLARLSPDRRRAEASGYFSSVFSATNILFPALGLWLARASTGGYNTVFLLSAVLAILGALLSYIWLRPAVPQLPAPAARRPGLGALALEGSVLLPTALSMMLSLAQPAVIAFLPLYARHQGISNIASYFVISGVVSLAVRPILGRVDDRIGHGYSIVAGFFAQIAGVLMILLIGTLPAILVGGALNALGNAVCSAAFVGLAVLRADPTRRGAAMGTFTISFQLGNGIGSVMAGTLLTVAGFGGMYAGSLVVLAGGMLLALRSWSQLGHQRPSLAELETAG